MHRGWVKLWRKTRDSAVWTDELFRLWFHCVMEANHKEGWAPVDRLEAPVMVKRGQFITGRFALHKELYPKNGKNDPSPVTLWRRLKVLEKLGNVIIETHSRFSLITVCEYKTYNSAEPQDDQQSDQQTISRRSAGDQQVITNKNEKNLKNEKESPGDILQFDGRADEIAPSRILHFAEHIYDPKTFPPSMTIPQKSTLLRIVVLMIEGTLPRGLVAEAIRGMKERDGKPIKDPAAYLVSAMMGHKQFKAGELLRGLDDVAFPKNLLQAWK